MSQNTKSKHRFTGSDAVSVLALSLITLGLTASILVEAMRDDSFEQAKVGAEALANQMAIANLGPTEDGVVVEKKAQPGRGLASIDGSSEAVTNLSLFEGNLGLDPWGQKYHYKLVRSIDGKPVRIFVWSSGPDKTLDTDLKETDIAQLASNKSFKFRGDDVGFVYQRN